MSYVQRPVRLGTNTGAGDRPVEFSFGRRHRPDYWLVIIMCVMLTIGLVVIYSISQALGLYNNVSSNFFISRQAIAIVLGFVAFFVTSKLPLKLWTKFYKIIIGVAALATLAALALPVNPLYPAHRWVRLGSMSFESVELVLFAVLIWLAYFFSERLRLNQIRDSRKTLMPLVIALLIIGVVVAGLQSDFGSMAILVSMMVFLAFISGVPMKRLVIIGTIIAVVGILAISTTPYRRQRLATFFHPASNCLTTGYQSCQALISVGSGGLTGLGLGRSVQAYGYQPEAANDSIFAIYGEKFGFVGSVVLLGLFMAFFYRLKEIALRAPDNFSRFVTFGVLVWLGLETVINIGAMIGLLPLKGITLPFVSYGGTSIVFFMAAVGLVFQISHYTAYVTPNSENQRGKADENRLDGRRVRRPYHASTSSRA